MRFAHAVLLGFIVAAGLAGCSKRGDEGSASGSVAPTNQTRAEYLDSLSRAFTKMDANSDGAVEAGEIPARRSAVIMARDADHNGAITRDEFVQGGLARFDRLDANHDGVLTKAERSADKETKGEANGEAAGTTRQ